MRKILQIIVISLIVIFLYIVSIPSLLKILDDFWGKVIYTVFVIVFLILTVWLRILLRKI